MAFGIKMDAKHYIVKISVLNGRLFQEQLLDQGTLKLHFPQSLAQHSED